ncbi:MAG: hypothetical protein U1E15_12395 [Hyphomicrobiales bacterium]
MKYVLIALCGLLVLFMGGCAVLALQVGPLALIPAGLAALNVMIIVALVLSKKQFLAAFYILGIVDLLVAAGAGIAAASTTAGSDWQVFLLAAGLFALKGILTLVYARALRTAP